MKILPYTTFAVCPIWNDHDGKSGTALIYTNVYTTRSSFACITKYLNLKNYVHILLQIYLNLMAV